MTSSGGTGRGWARVLCCAVILLPAPLLLAAATATTDPAQLGPALDKILNLPPSVKGRLSAHVVDLEAGEVLYDHRGGAPLIPASNMKLVVMAAAIDQFGRDHKFPTILAIRDTDLVVIGSGDPTIGDERLAEMREEKITALLHQWAGALKAAGIKQIPGNIVVDDLILDLNFTHPKWPANQYQSWYEAPIGGLNFNANCVEALVIPTQPGKPARIRLIPANGLIKIENKTFTGKKNTVVVTRRKGTDTLVLSGTVARKGKLQEVTVRDPGLYFGSVFKAVLAREGIPVGGKVVRERIRLSNGKLPTDCHLVEIHRTPLADVLGRCGKDSLGMMAEGLFKALGARQSGLGTWDSGRSAVHAFLRNVGVPADQVTVDDGSGLSRYNRLSAAAATQILRHVYHAAPADFELLRDSLAVAGTDGTLKKRLKHADTKGRIYGKTGTINGVRTLAGYIHTHSDRWLAFAIFYNHTGKGLSPKPRMDRACRLLVHWPDSPTSQAKADP